ncbi:metallophosphoesterase [Intrasporangium sp. YIM S08009]|uniref:metallophosphoesterase n=1 Tax=Intrasporangium zincisolvens TaxID=3080018 RepID=UPI002B06061B|nr:metallophosphoesterase [Intrasporangium sp. YIM S08009]
MSVFVAVLAALLALLTLALHRRLAVAPGWPRGVRLASATLLGLTWLLTLTAFAMQSGALDPRRGRWVAWAGMTWLVVAWYLLLGVAALGIACLAVQLVRRPGLRRPLLRVGTPLVVVAALGATGYGLAEASEPSVTPVTVTDPDLPQGLDGLRVALVTDLHAGPIREASFTRRVVDLVNAQRPDVVVLGGDLVDGRVAQVGDVLAPLADLRAPLGVYAVSGNHEFISQEADAWLTHWESLGIRVLRNEHVGIERGGASLTLAGVHDLTGRGTDASDAARALEGVDPAGFTIFVAHQPKAAENVQGRGVDLQLSGHTHGGQVWPFRYLVPLQQAVLDGLSTVGDVPALTSRGAGAWGPPVRVLAPPEVPVVTLRRG